MIKYSTKYKKNNDTKVLFYIIVTFLFVVWLCTPPGNKFAQICFYGNNTQFLIAKLTKTPQELNEWIYHRNSAVYLARMERKRESLKEIDKAVHMVPNYISETKLTSLYSDRAELRNYFGEHKGALNDFLRLKSPNIVTRFKIALLYKQVGNNKEALAYCNSILGLDPKAYIGYACIADIYAGVGKYGTSVKVYDVLIGKTKNQARYYADRAYYKKMNGDIEGYHTDIEKAKSLFPMVELDYSIIKETLYPKKLTLPII